MMLISHQCIPNYPAQELPKVHQKMIHAFQFRQEFQEGRGPTRNTEVRSVLDHIRQHFANFKNYTRLHPDQEISHAG